MHFSRYGALLFVVGCATALSPVPQQWQGVPTTARVAALCCNRSDAGVAIDHGKLAVSGKALTPEFREIDSFDVSLERREIIFSAKREDNFDVGLVSLDGSDIHWLPEDRADEVSAQWAPRGNKVSYIIHTPTGDLVRTVHIPTSFQQTADFPYARVKSMDWDENAERYSVALTSPDASERVESLKYSGETRKTETPPTTRLDYAVEPFAGGGILLKPSVLRYGEKLPFVVWFTDKPLEWSDARGALMRNSHVALLLVDKEPDWKEVHADFVVNPPRTTDNGQQTQIVSADVPPGSYRVKGRVIEVPPAIVESFASGWISQQLKATDGRR